MTPLQTAAQFAAYLHFLKAPGNAEKPRDDAHRFARTNWEKFLPAANSGLGQLLHAIAAPSPKRRPRSKAPAPATVRA